MKLCLLFCTKLLQAIKIFLFCSIDQRSYCFFPFHSIFGSLCVWSFPHFYLFSGLNSHIILIERPGAETFHLDIIGLILRNEMVFPFRLLLNLDIALFFNSDGQNGRRNKTEKKIGEKKQMKKKKVKSKKTQKPFISS